MIVEWDKASHMDDLMFLIREWRGIGQQNGYGILVYVPDVLAYLSSLATVFLLFDSGRLQGLLGMSIAQSPTGPQKIANEHFWYITPKYRGHARSMLKAAERWAKDHGCSHLIVNSSYMASDLCEKVSRIYELLRFKPFERVFIKEVA